MALEAMADAIREMLFLPSYVRGYHKYKDFWPLHLGQSLGTMAETANPLNRFAVAVLLDGDVVGTSPQENLGDMQSQSASFSRLML